MRSGPNHVACRLTARVDCSSGERKNAAHHGFTSRRSHGRPMERRYRCAHAAAPGYAEREHWIIEPRLVPAPSPPISKPARAKVTDYAGTPGHGPQRRHPRPAGERPRRAAYLAQQHKRLNRPRLTNGRSTKVWTQPGVFERVAQSLVTNSNGTREVGPPSPLS
jgi:hypothetical protein